MMGDFYHMFFEETSDLGAFISGGDYVHHVHLASRIRVLPGQDDRQFIDGFRGLKLIGYQDFCSLECGCQGDAEVEIPKSVQFLRDQWAASNRVGARGSPHAPADSDNHCRRVPARRRSSPRSGRPATPIDKLVELIQAGVDVFRLNMAHGDREEHQRRVDAIREASRQGRPAGGDAGRSGRPEDPARRTARRQAPLRRGRAGAIRPRRDGHGADELVTTYEPLVDELAVGDRVHAGRRHGQPGGRAGRRRLRPRAASSSRA